jgi:hypothetical protein
MKKIAFGGKPIPRPGQGSPDDWVADRSMILAEPTKRLTVDVPLSLHQRVKSQCAVRGEIMADVIRNLLEHHFAAEPLPEPCPATAITIL